MPPPNGVSLGAGFSTAGQVDSAQGNLASSFVNGFVNCGFGVDKLLTEDGNKWIYKNKVRLRTFCFHSMSRVKFMHEIGSCSSANSFPLSTHTYTLQGVGMLSATASLGLVLLWDVEGGLTEIDKFLYSSDESIKVLTLLVSAMFDFPNSLARYTSSIFSAGGCSAGVRHRQLWSQ